MRSSAFPFPLLIVAATASCGGRVDDEPAPATTTTPGANAPTNTPAAATGCAAACDHLRTCAPASESREDCLLSCTREHPDPVRAGIYGACVEALPCEEVARDLTMNFGPIGQCYARATDR